MTKIQIRVDIEKAYMDKNFIEIWQTLIGLTCHMTIVEELTKNWNHMQVELQALNQQMAVICVLQMALQELIANLWEQLEDLAQGDDNHENLSETIESTMLGEG